MNSHGVDNRSREELLMTLQEYTSKNRQLRIELERAKLERDRAVIDRRLLEMSSNNHVPEPTQINNYNRNESTIYKSSQPSPYSLDKMTQLHQQCESLAQGNSWAPTKMDLPSVKFEQPVIEEQPLIYPKKEIIPSDKIYEVCLRAFESFPNGRGKADDVENYINNNTKYEVPVRRVLGARLRTLAEKGKLEALIDRKVNKRPQEYRLMKRRLISNITGRDSKKPTYAGNKPYDQNIRKRRFIFCKHCKGIFYLLPHSIAINSFKHKCGNVTITRSLKGRGKNCKLMSSHSGPCIRFATKKERLNVKNIRSRGKAILDSMYRDMEAALPIPKQETEMGLPYPVSNQSDASKPNN